MILTALSGGVFSILLTWRPDVKLNCLCEKVPIRDATKILLKVRTHYFTETDFQKIEMGPLHSSKMDSELRGQIECIKVTYSQNIARISALKVFKGQKS